ncbi:hypothetical protein [Halococcoides cellulosivorans]|uniref:Uncharacterized protein n=1 Tax=Halococcoides cellulosivorans TaxID=1679096 RepID=A0A2R4X2Q5_9EURY|nr:hypothetical protein [Halococcoides cellulosivorans]AWB28081.1 hypothetical protein HARCEL1_10370 [Halococcoides cellulosivorans]
MGRGRAVSESAADALGAVVGLAAFGTVLAFAAELTGVPTGGPDPATAGLTALIVATLAGAARSRLRSERDATGVYLVATGGLITFTLAPSDSLVEWAAVAVLAVAGLTLLTEGIRDANQSTR